MKKRNILNRVGVAIVSCLFSLGVAANPVLNQVVQGSATVQQTNQTTTINQTSQQAIIDWHSFNIQQGEHTHFEQPVNGVALNRINATQGASQIYGQLTATGQIILINTAGVFFGPSSYVNVGGLIASTAGLSDTDFLAGNYRFNAVSPNAGMIINKGTIIAAKHGLIALLGNGVQNDGSISAHLGKVVIGSGKSFTLSFNGNDTVNFSVDSKAVRGITHSGSIRADGGTVIVNAQVAQSVLDNVINLSGVIIARAVVEYGGEIFIVGDQDGGVVRLSSLIDASGKGVNQRGGNITVTGQNILLDDGAQIDASGYFGGGNILIGGNYQGLGPLPNAERTVMLANAVINADALYQGDGGNVILWGNDFTKAYGTITARGGLVGGNGGFIETSGKHTLDVNGIRVDASAANGRQGQWLLDPSDITISSASGSNITSGSPFEPSSQASNSILNVDTLTAALESADVTVKTTSGAGPGSGDITISNAITWSSPSTLFLSAVNDIFVNAAITAVNGSASFTASGSVTFNAVVNLASLAVSAVTTTFTGSGITTAANQTYNSNIAVTGNTTLTVGGSVQLGGNVSGSSNLSIEGNALVNELSIKTGSAQTWTITALNSGSVALSGYTGTLSFSGVESLGGTSSANDTFIFQSNGRVTGVINGGSGSSTDTLNFSSLNDPVNIRFGDGQNRAYRIDGVTLANFNSINSVIGNSANTNQILLSNLDTPFRYTGFHAGIVGNELSFTNFRVSFDADPVSDIIEQTSPEDAGMMQHGDAMHAYVLMDGDVTVVPFKEVCTSLQFGDEEVSSCQG